ncbi:MULTISPECIES: putative baseplate assembly protein [unclassified Streptomyces]|uniref:putative baseplate assembly protein n=1 Tax=unclassified Streptomyces TaxID=2593676 RepID=UPI00404337AB
MSLESERGRLKPPDLDDRTWQDLVTQMRDLIPEYAPGWTDRNVSDIGISLIELFAWLVEGLTFRLNQVPERTYIAFLNLFGITRRPPSPARAYLTFSAAGAHRPVLVPAGTWAQTPVREGETSVVFETDEDVNVLPVAMAKALVVAPTEPTTSLSFGYTEESPRLVGPPADRYRLTVAPGRTVQLCFGFDQPTREEIQLRVSMYTPAEAAAVPSPPTVTWVYSRADLEPANWPAIEGATGGAVDDATESLGHSGKVRLTLPADWSAQRPTSPPGAGQAAPHWTSVPPTGAETVTDPYCWLGLRVSNTSQTSLILGFDRVAFNSALARTALTLRTPEILGESTGQAFQTFALRHQPLFRRPASATPYGDLVVEVGQGVPPSWETWRAVDELPPDAGNVYRFNPVTGEIFFGDMNGVPEPESDGAGRDEPDEPLAAQHHGSVPPAGSTIRATYRYVSAGTGGNVLPGQVTTVGPTPSGALPTGVTQVTNLGAGQNGIDEEPIEDTLRRAPQRLKIRDRAVTVEDYEHLAGEASPEVAISRCLVPYPPEGDPWEFGGIHRAPGTVNLIVVPDQGTSVPRPTPSEELLQVVSEHLNERRDMTGQLVIHAPCYLPITVVVDVLVWRAASQAGVLPATVEAETRRKISAFLHPTRGGPAGRGWRIGQSVLNSELFRAITPPDDVGYISRLLVRPGTPLYGDGTRPYPPLPPGTPAGVPGAASVRLADYELVCAADDDQHAVHVTVDQF